MKKHLLFFLAFSLYPSRSTSQTIDKERLTEYFQNQQFEDAIDYLNRFFLKDSNSLQLLNYLGYAYYMNDEKGKAKIYYLKLLNSDPENISANQYLANICISENNNDSAKIFVQRLIGLAPGRANFYRILAGIYKKDQQTDSAIFYYNRAYLLAPSDSKNIIALADYSIDVTNYRKADSILKIALTNDSLNVSYL
jgi:tetratricopeptide (TPR) repeat protein